MICRGVRIFGMSPNSIGVGVERYSEVEGDAVTGLQLGKCCGAGVLTCVQTYRLARVYI